MGLNMKKWFAFFSFIFAVQVNAAPRVIADPIQNTLYQANRELFQSTQAVRALSDRHLDRMIEAASSAAQVSCADIKDILSQFSSRAESLKIGFKNQESRLDANFNKNIGAKFLRLQTLSDSALQKCADHQVTETLDLIYQELMSTGFLVQSYLASEQI